MSQKVDFKLRQVLQGHEDDVRALVAFEHDGSWIVTGSRDATLKGWQETDEGWQERYTLVGHTGYVVAVAAVPPGSVPSFRGPGILSGSRDTSVRLWSLESKEAVATLQEHTYQVNAVGILPNGSVASCGLDGKLNVWTGSELLHSIKAHDTAVLCLAVLQSGEILTGSGDKTIKRWQGDQLRATYTGHSDSVRSLCELPGTGFVSASHDMTLRVWNPEGTTLSELVGHTALVYSCAATPAGLIASGSEDNTVRLWANADCLQVIAVPGCAWCVGFAPSGDLLVGASSFCAYVWTQSSDRQASDSVIQAYEADVASRQQAASAGAQGNSQTGSGGGVPEEQIKPESALLMPGSKDNEVIFVRNAAGIVMAHEWHMSSSEWSTIGEVMAQAPDNVQESRKYHDGREWDFVFDVDIADGAPPLKLAMQRDENVYDVADRFIMQQSLPQTYREQIVKFILENTAGQMKASVETGVPRDPLSEGPAAPTPPAPAAGFVYTPHRQHQVFEGVPAADKLHAKLKELSAQVPSAEQLTEDELAPGGALQQLLQLLPRKGAGLSADCMGVLGKLARWPAAQLFPVLDIFRLLVLDPGTAKLLSYDAGPLQSSNAGLGGLLARGLSSAAPGPSVLLALRLACNCCQHGPLRAWLLSDTGPLFDLLADANTGTNKNSRAALATLLLNFGVAVCNGQTTDRSDGRARALSMLCELASAAGEDEHDSKFRLLLAVTTISYGDQAAAALVRDLGFADEAARVKASANCPDRLTAVASDVAVLLKN